MHHRYPGQRRLRLLKFAKQYQLLDQCMQYAVSRLTGTRHTLAFWYWNNGNPVVTRGERFISGDYDLLFLRGTTTSAEKYVYRTDNSDIIPNAVKHIGQCLRID